MAGAIAQSLYVTVLLNKVTAFTGKYVPPAAEGAGLPPSSLTQLFAGIASGSFVDVPGITPKIEAAVGGAVQHAYTHAFHYVFYCSIPFTILLVLAALFVPNMEEYLHNNVAKKLSGKGLHEKAPRDVEKA